MIVQEHRSVLTGAGAHRPKTGRGGGFGMPRSVRRRGRVGVSRVLTHLLGVATIVSVTVVAVSIGVRGTTALAAGGSGSDWPVYHGDFTGSGVAGGSSTFNGASPAWTSRGLHGQIYGEPLVVGNEVVVATEADNVYALN